MSEQQLCNLQIHINGQHTFFLSETILSKYSGKLRKMIKQEKRRTQIRNSGIEIDDFPGGPTAFELVSRFCYSDGVVSITVSNVSLLHCCAIYLGMTEKAHTNNLLHQTETFLEGIFQWSWNEVLTCLSNCDAFFSVADSCGLIQKILCSLLAKIAQNSDLAFLTRSSSSSSSSPETARSLSSPTVFSSRKPSWAWWFQDLTVLSPRIIEQFLRGLGSFGIDNNNLVLTRFLLHYLKTAKSVSKHHHIHSSDYAGLADTATHGVVLMGKTAFSCRGLFAVLRIVSNFGLSRENRSGLERLIGSMLDQAMLDDLLVSSGGGKGGVYDVNFVIRLIRLYVRCCDEMCLEKMKRVGELIDMYLGEIAPDPILKVSKFLGVAECLPDCARDSFDQVYRAIDIYLESHPSLSLEERSRLCRCLNYEKLSLEACKDLAKNPRIPPRIAVQALASQHPTLPSGDPTNIYYNDDFSGLLSNSKINNYVNNNGDSNYEFMLYKNDDENSRDLETEKVNLERMQWRVVELEKVCREMKGQMAKMVKIAPHRHNRPLPRMC